MADINLLQNKLKDTTQTSSRRTSIFATISGLILLLLVGACVGLYFLTKDVKQKTESLMATNIDLKSLGEAKLKVLLTAVPNMVVENYVRVFRLAGLQAQALEIEALSLIRSVVGQDMSNNLLIDIGAKNASINLVDSGYLRLSKNLNVGGDTVTNSIAQSLSVNFTRAEQFKKDFGLAGSSQQIPQIMRPILDIIINEAEQLINFF